jgi:putative transposase
MTNAIEINGPILRFSDTYFLDLCHPISSGVFTKQIIDDLRDVSASVCADFEVELLEFDGEDDHVHLLVNYPPKVAVSALGNSLKGVSSCMIRKKNYQNIRKKLWGGAPIEILRQYIEHKKTPH